jgi:hypothetical protein
MKKNITKIYISLIALVALIIPVKSLADEYSGVNEVIEFTNPIKASNIHVLITKILNFVVQFGTMIAIFFVIYAGFLFVVARGKPDEITKAKTTLVWTLVGAMVLIGAQALSNVVCNTAVELGANSALCGK